MTAEVEVKSRTELRDWLAANHAQTDSIWLIYWKKHTDHYLPIEEIIEELICWGWIDAVTRGVDGDRTSIRVSPRRKGSAWSAVNKRIVERVRASGAMTPAGEAKIAAAMEDGSWNFLDDVERLEVPEDLAAAFTDGGAGWAAYPRSVKRGTLEWIKTAKRRETRAARIAEVAGSAAIGIRPKPFRR